MHYSSKILLLAAIASGAMASASAQAQTTAMNDGETALHGTGATSIQGLLVQQLNCDGSYSDLGILGDSTVSGTLLAVPEPPNLFSPAPSPSFNCATTDLEPGFLGRYVGSGSGTGRGAWIHPGTLTNYASPPMAGTDPAFAIGAANPNPFGTWNKTQFVLADSSPTDSDLTTYTGGAAQAAGGAPILFPMYLLPIAIAYSPTYARKSASGITTDYNFNIQFPQTILGTAAAACA